MDTPLGDTAGNALEVVESVEVLQGGGPADLIEVTVALAERMLELVGIDADPRKQLESGSAFDKYREMVAAQGGDPDATLPTANEVRTLDAQHDGYLQRLDARGVGVAAWRLGAGRAALGDKVSASAGVVCKAKPGDRVKEGQGILELHAEDPSRFDAALEALDGAIEIGDSAPEEAPLVIETIS